MTIIETLKQLIAEDEAELAKLPDEENGLITYNLDKKKRNLNSSIAAMKRTLEKQEKKEKS